MYLDGEMPAETFKERMLLIAERYGSDIQLFGYNRDDLGTARCRRLTRRRARNG